MPGGPIRVTVTDPIFLDKSGERLKSPPVPPGPVGPLLPAVPQPPLVARPSGSVQLTVLAATTRLSVRAGSAVGTAIGLALGSYCRRYRAAR